jgi:hypothetical protein
MSQAPGGHDDPVVRCGVGISEGAVAADHLDGVVTGAGEAAASAVGEVLVEFDADDRPARTGQLREQRRVDAGRGTDLQDVLSGPHVELFEHVGHEAGARRGGQRGAVRVAFGDDLAAVVDRLQVDAGKELLARHGAERLPHTRGSDVAALLEQRDELVTEHGGVGGAGAGLGRFHYAYPTVGGTGGLVAGSAIGWLVEGDLDGGLGQQPGVGGTDAKAVELEQDMVGKHRAKVAGQHARPVE